MKMEKIEFLEKGISMQGKLGLIKNDLGVAEKRVLPRFPFCYLTFKSEKVFEVKDVSYSGMQLQLKNGQHQFKQNDTIQGEIHWPGDGLKVTGVVKWIQGSRLGVEFKKEKRLLDSIRHFFSTERIAETVRAIPLHELEIDVPAKLKYWFKGNGPFELFIWQHTDGELSRFQIILFDQFIEWEDGLGIKTGRTVSIRDVETPLMSEGEISLLIDDTVDIDKTNRVADALEVIPEGVIAPSLMDFLKRKVRA